jgi:flagellar hook assembly protein FlgD
LEAYENRIDTIQVSSLGLYAANRFQFEVNPLDGMGEADQLEQYRFNNKVSIPFYVINDQTNPIVDVTFDGMHIMNGEIITPQPQILIQLKDDNEYLVFSEIADTSNLSFFIQEPNGNLEKINYNDPDLQFEFGNTNNNQLKVIYRPTFEKNGKHLMLVQAKDKSGNTSGSRDYEIEFEINRTAAVTQVLNYPNPFSTRTQFVFTLTGTQIPDEFTIRIYTISGKIVKEIYKQDLGTLRIGNNITDYYWDGTDNYGDQLANGVYFYTVDISFFNEDFEQIETEADQYFTKGMGKMYLMR